ncbi:hypothetical protein NI401_12595 [Acinetobacter indicus]|uniref:hypothetical protein n=1 Tax=Acinetobacter indicus TaxID=756892 RepID=UPI00209BA9D0|nr:hypothetical protein [Acinetobacter indicus]MCO8103729.1 hypothetical protein [Acinetobacter indicus]
MKLQNLVKFNQQGFFEGAVQLGWFQNRVDQANIAASTFIFHGPQYHGALNDQEQHTLKDTASIVVELIESLAKAQQGREDNPYWLATAGYGAGKSHLAVTIATLLSKPKTPLASFILENLARVDAQLGLRAQQSIANLTKPSLVIALDGMGNFHLGNELNRVVLRQLEIHKVNDQAIRDLSPRFTIAQKFVEKNYHLQLDKFKNLLGQYDQAVILKSLSDHDEEIYSAVDQIFLDSTGSVIPVDGQESAQDLLQTLCNEYCGENKPFENIIILFDEFGRYLEYAADRPDLAGDSTLQQIFQGIQDNSDKIRFLGFIQYELKTYLKRFNAKNARQLQRYITRFDTANKVHLSSNLETIFANIIQKDESELSTLLSKYSSDDIFHQTWLRLSQYIPKSKLYPVWSNEKLFNQIIAKGCWPLHPFATWLLTRQENTVQSRSALTFIKDLLQKNAELDVFNTSHLLQISAADLVQDYLLDEMLAAERDTGSNVIETLQALLQKFHSALTPESAKTLTAIAILQNLKLRQLTQYQANELLQELANFDEINLNNQIKFLSEIGAAEWNNDLGRYELLTDGASRASFNSWLRKASQQFTSQDIGELFISKSNEIGLNSIECAFAQNNNVSTLDWLFEARSYLSHQISSQTLDLLIDEWKNSNSYKDAKGRVIYIYVQSDQDLEECKNTIHEIVSTSLTKHKINKLPFLFIYLYDHDDKLGQTLTRLKSIESMSDEDRHQFMRFIQDEKDDILTSLKNITSSLLKNREYFSPALSTLPSTRLTNIVTTIFEHCYPSIIPFVFDGLQMNHATGPADITSLFNIMVNRQFSVAWLQGQKTPLQNRFDTLFKKTWSAINLQTGKLITPQEPKVKALFDFLTTSLTINPNLDLKTLHQKFVLPGYGLNDCSFALLLGLYLSQDTPQYRIIYKGELKNTSEWVQLVTNRKTGTILNLNILADTQLQQMTMSIRDEWVHLFNNLSLEKNPKNLIKLYQEVETKKTIDPIPHDLEAQYNLLTNQLKEVFEQHKRQQEAFDNVLIQVIKGCDSTDIRDYSKLLNALPKLVRFNKDIEQKKSFLELPSAIPLNELTLKGKSILTSRFNRFFDDLVLISYQDITSFRERSEQHQRSFNALLMHNEANKIQDKTNALIQRVEERERFKYLLQDIESYINTSPNKTLKKKDLQILIHEGDRLLKDMESKPKIFDSAQTLIEKQNRIKAVQNELRHIVMDYSQQFSNLYAEFNSLDDLKNRILNAEQLLAFFVSTDEYQEILKIQKQLSFALERIRLWITDGLSSETLLDLLNQIILKDNDVINAFLSEQQIEAEWEFIDEIFEPIRDEFVLKARNHAEIWIQQTQNELSIADQNLSILKPLINKFDKLPTIFDNDQLLKVEALRTSVLSQYRDCHTALFETWFSALQKSFKASNNDQSDLLSIRTKLKNIPQQILPLFKEEEDQILELQKEIAYTLDMISLEDLVERINNLKPEFKAKLLALIER